jgi:hypothetical protein
MTLWIFAAAVLVLAWTTLIVLFWMSFEEDQHSHPIYREEMNSPERTKGPGESASLTNDNGNRTHYDEPLGLSIAIAISAMMEFIARQF